MDILLRYRFDLIQATKKKSLFCMFNTDYELGPSFVKCGLNGRWLGDFPTCRKKEACTFDGKIERLSNLQIKYKNVMKINGRAVAVIDSVANYSCLNGP